MPRHSIDASAGKPSLFYLMIAESFFQRAVDTRYSKIGGALREIGRSYLAKAISVTPIPESQAPQLRAPASAYLNADKRSHQTAQRSRY